MSMIEKLAFLKKRDNLTTEEVSARSDIPLGTLNKIFNGQTKNHSLKNIVEICDVFHVPIQYLVDNSVAADCDIAAYAKRRGLFLISEREETFLHRVRGLNPVDQKNLRNIVENYFHLLSDFPSNGAQRLLPCYVASPTGKPDLPSHQFEIKIIRVDVDDLTRCADYAFVLPSDALAPAFKTGELLAVQRGSVRNDQLGVFTIKGKYYIRRLSIRNGAIKLIPLNKSFKCISIQPGDEFSHYGNILGVIRQYHWLPSPPNTHLKGAEKLGTEYHLKHFIL